jgi:hypothetical protein
MHFIEQLFGASPDAGSGSLEFALVLIPFALIALKRIRRGLDAKSASQR